MDSRVPGKNENAIALHGLGQSASERGIGRALAAPGGCGVIGSRNQPGLR